MYEILTKFLDAKIDYQTIFMIIGVYLVSLWFMFCLWVFVDANKRYKKFLVALLMSLLVFVFNFPALIFYLIIRPEDNEWAEINAVDSIAQGGVQVPLVNFTGQNGEVQLSINLQLHSKSDPNSDMVINVGWDSNNPNMKVAQRTQTHSQNPSFETKQNPIGNAFRNRLLSLKNKAHSSIKNVQSTVSSTVNAGEMKKEDAADNTHSHNSDAKKDNKPEKSNISES